MAEITCVISHELTTKQRSALADLKERGQTGYFYKGKLHIRQDQGKYEGGRHYVNAKRKSQQGNGGGTLNRHNTRDQMEVTVD